MSGIKSEVPCLYTDKDMPGYAYVLVSPRRSVIAIAHAEVARIAKNAANQAIATSTAVTDRETFLVRAATEKMANAISESMIALWAEQEETDNGHE